MVSVGLSQDGLNTGKSADLSSGGIYHTHAGPFASWMRGERWTSPPRSRESRLLQMTCWLSRENGEIVGSDEAKRVIYTEDGERGDYIRDMIGKAWERKIEGRVSHNLPETRVSCQSRHWLARHPSHPASGCGVIESQTVRPPNRLLLRAI
jgi:hypothetical protein